MSRIGQPTKSALCPHSRQPRLEHFVEGYDDPAAKKVQSQSHSAFTLAMLLCADDLAPIYYRKPIFYGGISAKLAGYLSALVLSTPDITFRLESALSNKAN